MYTEGYNPSFDPLRKEIREVTIKDELLQHVKIFNIAEYYNIPDLEDLAVGSITLPPELDNVDDILPAARETCKAENSWRCGDQFVKKCVDNMDLFIERKNYAALQSVDSLFDDVIKVFGKRSRAFKPLMVDLEKTNVDNVSNKVCRKLLRDIRDAWNINYYV